MQQFIGSSIVELAQMLFLLFGALGIMLSENWNLTLIAILPIIPLSILTLNFGKRVSELFFNVDTALGDLSARLQENISGVQVIRAFAREPHEIERFDKINRLYIKARVRVIGEWSQVMPTTHLLITLGTILILLVGGPLVFQGKMTVGELVAFNAYLLMLSAPVQQLAWLVNSRGKRRPGRGACSKFWGTARDPLPGRRPTERERGAVEFRDVSLFYQDEKIRALSDINLTVQPNQLIALIGQTGSGKTSLVNLIPRFYDVSEGAVLVDGVDVRRVDLDSLRRQIGIVLQTSLLFSESIRENISYGRPDASAGRGDRRCQSGPGP